MAMWEEIEMLYGGVHGRHGLGVRNEEGIKIMDFCNCIPDETHEQVLHEEREPSSDV